MFMILFYIKKNLLNIIEKIFSFFYINTNNFNSLYCIRFFYDIKILILKIVLKNILFKIIKD